MKALTGLTRKGLFDKIYIGVCNHAGNFWCRTKDHQNKNPTRNQTGMLGICKDVQVHAPYTISDLIY